MDGQVGGYAGERMVEQQRAGDDRVARKMPGCARMVGRKLKL